MNLRSGLLSFAFALIFVDTVGYQIVIPSLPLFAERFHLTETEAGVIYATYGIASLLLYIPFGYLVDRFGGAKFILSGLFLLGLSSLLFACAQNFYVLLISRTIQGVSATATWSGIIPFVADVAEREKRGISMAGIGIAYSAGSVFGPSFGGIGGLKTPFLLFSTFSFVLLVLFFLLPKIENQEMDNDELNLSLLFRNKNLIIACVSILICFFAIGAMEVLLPLKLYESQISKAKIGTIFTILGALSALSQLLAGWWSDKRGRVEPIIAGLIAGAVIIPFLGIANELILLLLFIPLIFAFASALAPTLPLIAEGVPQKNLGIAYGIYNTLFSLGLIGGSVIIPLLTQSYGLKQALFTISFLMLCAVIVSLIIRRL